MNVSQNLNLAQLFCDFNYIASLDISNNKILTEFNCKYNDLNTLNVKNGNNKNMTVFESNNNGNLKEICTDDAKFASINFPYKDEWATYLDGDCRSLSPSKINSKNSPIIFPNPSNGTFTIQNTDKIEDIFITNMLGQKIEFDYSESNNYTNVSLKEKGLFLLEFRTGNKLHQTKIISK